MWHPSVERDASRCRTAQAERDRALLQHGGDEGGELLPCAFLPERAEDGAVLDFVEGLGHVELRDEERLVPLSRVLRQALDAVHGLRRVASCDKSALQRVEGTLRPCVQKYVPDQLA